MPEPAPPLCASSAGPLFENLPPRGGGALGPLAVEVLLAPPISLWPPPFLACAFQRGTPDPIGLSFNPDPKAWAQSASAAPPAGGTRATRSLGAQESRRSPGGRRRKRSTFLPGAFPAHVWPPFAAPAPDGLASPEPVPCPPRAGSRWLDLALLLLCSQQPSAPGASSGQAVKSH